MATGETTEMDRDKSFFDSMKHFPPVIDGRINLVEFLEASTSLVALIELNGKLFAPVKYDVQGNIDKIKKNFQYNNESCLLELMLEKGNQDITGAESVFWLNKAVLFMELLLNEVLAALQANQYDVSMKNMFVVAYEGSVKKYHNWCTQQIFNIICTMSGTLLQYMKSLGVNNDANAFASTLATYNIKQNLVRCKIDDFFKEHSFFDERK